MRELLDRVGTYLITDAGAGSGSFQVIRFANLTTYLVPSSPARYNALMCSPAIVASSRAALFPSLLTTRLLAFRRSSDGPDEMRVLEIDLDAEGWNSGTGSAEVDAIRTRRVVDDAIHGIVVRQFAPGWLPFVPGASYWIPRQKRPYGVTEFIASIADLKLRNSLSEEEEMSLTNERGWPSSAYFFEGLSALQVKSPRTSSMAQSDDEDC